MSTSLAAISKARQQLAEARTLDDVLEIRDKAEAIRVYVRSAEEGLEAQNHAAEIKLRAERKAGELLAEMDKNKGGEQEKKKASNKNMGQTTGDIMSLVVPKLEDIGVTKKTIFSLAKGSCRT